MGKLDKIVRKQGLDKVQRHIFMCCDEDREKCCSAGEFNESWKHLKSRLKELGMDERAGIQKTRTQCLDVCRKGPIMVIYPDGVWYHSCTPEAIDRIVNEHLLQGRIVKDLLLAGGKADAR